MCKINYIRYYLKCSFVLLMFVKNSIAQPTTHFSYDTKGNITYVNYNGSSPCPKSYQRIANANDSTVVQAENFKLKSFPNPTKGHLNIAYTLSDQAKVDIKIIDAKGNAVLNVLPNLSLSAGEYSKELNINCLTPGIYFILVQVNDKVYRDRVLLLE